MAPSKVIKPKKENASDLAARIKLRALEANKKKLQLQQAQEQNEASENENNNGNDQTSGAGAEPEDIATPITSFAQLELVPEILESCEKLKFKSPTPIQAEAIPIALQGRDIIGLAQTGSGKTAAFAIPILQRLWHEQGRFYACVLLPTRELAYQIRDTFDALGASMGVQCATIVGGMDMMDQARELLKRPHIIVATPGRLMDHLENTKGFSLSLLQFLVMDEADRLLDMDFGPSLDKILKIIPQKRTTYLFSATMTSKIEKLQRLSLTNPAKVAVSDKYTTVNTLIQRLMVVPDGYKNTYLLYLLDEFTGKSMIIFTRTCLHLQRTLLLARILGFSAIPLHGQLSQLQRLGALSKFKSGQRNILVLTDVALRGLDIPDVDVVINYDIPTDSKLYIHRVGRTARLGKSGKSVSLVTQYDLELILRIEKVIDMKIPTEKPDRDFILLLHDRVDKLYSEAVRQTKEFHESKKNHSGHKRRD